MRESHALSEKAVKKLGLEKVETKDDFDKKKVVREWPDHETYWNEWMDERLEKREKWYRKIGDFFKFRIGWRLRDWYYDTKWYFSNLKRFQPILKTWRSFDYQYQIDLFKFGIKQLADAMEYYGNEIPETRIKRIEAIKELINEIDRDYEEDVRVRLNYNFHDKAKVLEYEDGSICFLSDDDDERQKETENYYAEIKKERKAHYQKIFDLLIGQDHEYVQQEINKHMSALTDEDKQKMSEGEWYNKFYNEIWDGSGIEGWWD